MDHPKIPELRNLTSPLLQFFLVKPDGHIKRALFERNLDCPLLLVTWIKDESGRKVALDYVDVHPTFKRQGWDSLESLYIAEDRAEDFASYVKWSDHANALAEACAEHEPLPVDYLPDEVLRRRREYKTQAAKIKLPPPKKRKADKGDKGEVKP